MPEQIYKPVRIDTKKAIAKAKLRPGFTQAWDALEEEYAALEALLGARKMAGLTKKSWLTGWEQPKAQFRAWSLRCAMKSIRHRLQHSRNTPMPAARSWSSSLFDR